MAPGSGRAGTNDLNSRLARGRVERVGNRGSIDWEAI